MEIIHGVAMRKEWSKQTTLSFSISLVGIASIEPGNDSVVIKIGSVRVWQLAAPNALTGNSSVGFFGTDEQKLPEKGIKTSTPPTPKNLSLSRTKKNWMHF